MAKIEIKSEATDKLLLEGNDSKLMFKVANSWGTTWGQKGYFYLPYKYFGLYPILLFQSNLQITYHQI